MALHLLNYLVQLQRMKLSEAEALVVATTPFVPEHERTTTLEIPEVLEQIFKNLPESDLVHCLTVCKA